MKICSKCAVDKPLEDFHKLASNKRDGRMPYCKLCNNARAGKWNKDNTARYRKNGEAWRQANSERDRATRQAWYEANRDKACADARAWHAANRERTSANGRAWRKNNPEADRAKASRRRYAASVSMDATDKILSVEYRRAIANDLCVYCHAAGEHDDHVIPLSKGGTDHWHNIVRACERCNLAKSNHDLDHFLEVTLPALITDPSTHAQSR